MSFTRDRVVLITLAAGAAPSVVRDAALRLGVPEALTGCACRSHGPQWFSIHVEWTCDEDAIDAVRRLPGIERAVMTGAGLAARTTGQRAAVVLRHGVIVGTGALTMMAGPCSVESEEQILEVAEAIKVAGGRVLRGGVFKPRSSPYAFGGLGPAGLELLALAGEQVALPVVTEVLDIEHVDLVARYADIIQIGARNMQNFPLLFRAGSHASGRPVLLKRGFSATLDELLHAAEYVLLGRLFAGHEPSGLILCERGIRTFETATRFTLDVAAIPILQDRTRLPVIADPSHAAGARRLVPPLARAAAAAGADGLLLEVHPDPDRAWSDGAQTLDLRAFADLMRELDDATNRGTGGKRAWPQTASRTITHTV